MNKIEQTVAGGIQSSNKGRPGNGALRGSCGAKLLKCPFRAQAPEVREVMPMALDETGIHTIDAEHN